LTPSPCNHSKSFGLAPFGYIEIYYKDLSENLYNAYSDFPNILLVYEQLGKKQYK
jgi:hypothetical protein